MFASLSAEFSLLFILYFVGQQMYILQQSETKKMLNTKSNLLVVLPKLSTRNPGPPQWRNGSLVLEVLQKQQES